jgi:hypothetical protein
MGYTLIIGERASDASDGAQEMTLPQAPLFPGDELTGRSNKRMISSRDFASFCTATGLTSILSAVAGNHPGCLEMTASLVNELERALEAYEDEARPRLPAGFGPLHDAHLARLRWLCWWSAWALRTCRKPVLANR